MTARDQVREYVSKVLRENKDDTAPVGDSDSLVLSGRLTSVDVVDVLTFLESRFGFAMAMLASTRRDDRPARYTARGDGKRGSVALLLGCVMEGLLGETNRATERTLVTNGYTLVDAPGQRCCGALHVHAGLREDARKLARCNIDAILEGGFDALITNAAGCGSTLKEYHDLLEHDAAYAEKAQRFSHLVQDVNEFLASIGLNLDMGPVPVIATYQDSCHLAHGQKIGTAPRRLLAAVPKLQFREMPLSDLCCGSAGVYNVVENSMSMALLEKKMESVNSTGAAVIVTANPGCMLQLQAGARLHGKGQRVAHVVEILDQAYKNI